MIREMTGDLLRDGKGILCHQVNYAGIMGGGIAYSISKILPVEEFDKYQQYCYLKGRAALGTVLFSSLPETDRIIANLFCQGDFVARDGSEMVALDTLTDYGAMLLCFTHVRDYAACLGLPVYIPGYIGCGIAGGDWQRVKGIIDEVFSAGPVEAVIVYWEKEVSR